MKRDVDYVVRDGEVIIVDEFTGRLMLGRRYNEGLHQAIEAKAVSYTHLSRRGGRERSVDSSVSPANLGLRHWIPHKNML